MIECLYTSNEYTIEVDVLRVQSFVSQTTTISYDHNLVKKLGGIFLHR